MAKKKKSRFDDGYQYYQKIGLNGLEDIEQPSEIKMAKPIKKEQSSKTKETKQENKQYIRYKYTGPVWKVWNDKRILFSDHVDIETLAISKEKAISNIKYRISKNIFKDDKKIIRGTNHVGIENSLVKAIC